jgi:hypothetical protein
VAVCRPATAIHSRIDVWQLSGICGLNITRYHAIVVHLIATQLRTRGRGEVVTSRAIMAE